jgi:hypothetical protein
MDIRKSSSGEIVDTWAREVGTPKKSLRSFCKRPVGRKLHLNLQRETLRHVRFVLNCGHDLLREGKKAARMTLWMVGA